MLKIIRIANFYFIRRYYFSFCVNKKPIIPRKVENTEAFEPTKDQIPFIRTVILMLEMMSFSILAHPNWPFLYPDQKPLFLLAHLISSLTTNLILLLLPGKIPIQCGLSWVLEEQKMKILFEQNWINWTFDTSSNFMI